MRKLALFFLICLVVILLRWPPDELRPGCDYPLPYRIGEVDERFRLGPVTLREIVNDSAATWVSQSISQTIDQSVCQSVNLQYVFCV